MRWRWVLIAGLLGPLLPPARAPASPTLKLQTVRHFDFPTAIAFTESGRTMFVNERAGRVRIIRDGALRAQPFARVRTTLSGEGGLLGLALHPRFESGEPWVYVFFTLPDGSADRVVRFRADGARAAATDVIMSRLPSGAPYHHGGVLAFGPDGNLYVTNGEAHDQQRAQDPRALGGKIYRVNDDGSIPADNPFPGSPTWSYGHRNPFGLAFDPETGHLWESENGPSSHDEVNLIRRAGNYGWPVVTGAPDARGFIDASVDYTRIIVPTGMAFAGDALGPSYRDVLLLGTYGESSIHSLRLNAARTRVASDTILRRVSGGVVAMARGPDAIYMTTPSAILRLGLARPTSPRATASASATSTGNPTARGTPAATRNGRPGGVALVTVAAITVAALEAVRRFRRRRRR